MNIYKNSDYVSGTQLDKNDDDDDDCLLLRLRTAKPDIEGG